MVALQKQSPPRNAQPTSLTSNGNSTNPSTNPHKDTIEEAGPFQNAPIGSHSKWKLRMRPDDDGEAQVWWFASTAIPLLAATTGPLANVMSIAALITKWRANYDPDFPGIDSHSVGYADPRWCIALNVASLVCGFVGNVFLLFNFTRRVRYIIALPMTIILWYFATGISYSCRKEKIDDYFRAGLLYHYLDSILGSTQRTPSVSSYLMARRALLSIIAVGFFAGSTGFGPCLVTITISMNTYVPPHRPEQTYSQGFWHAVIAAVLYLVSSMILMINMLGYFLGHYPQHFELTDEQRNLILQTIMFFIWLAGGAGVFAKVSGSQYVDMLYFCDVTILTVGFGDFHPINDAGRGLVFPYSVGGIIILGLMVGSIRKFAQEISHDNIVKSHVEKRRIRTIGRSVTTSIELEQRRQQERHHPHHEHRPAVSAPFNLRARAVAFEEEEAHQLDRPTITHPKKSKTQTIYSSVKALKRVGSRQPRLLLLREEKDRFTAMREIQKGTATFKRYSALGMSIIAFGLLWCVGAVGFWKAEAKSQGLSYFQALYFCYVSLLTIGYGDLSPSSNAGKPLFIVWSLIAVPTMTILISDMGDTVIASFKRATFRLADWTVLPKAGIWRAFLEKHPWLLRWLQKKAKKAAEEKRMAEGFRTGPMDEDDNPTPPTLEEIALQTSHDEPYLARKLALAIRRTANDLKSMSHQRYSYEEWVEYTRLIRFSRMTESEVDEKEQEQGLIEWDWIGENSPMLAEESEAEWVLDRLCESLDRYMKKLHRGRAHEIVPRSGNHREGEMA